MKFPPLAMLLAVGLTATAQELPAIGDLSAPRANRSREHVQYVLEPQVLPAGRSTLLRVRFAVDDGFHINSHRPKGDLLVATELRVDPESAVHVAAPVYPAGQAFSFPASPGDVLDVYTGEFAVELPVAAVAGVHTLKANLRYQACDRAMCYPVRSLPVTVEFTAK